MTPAKPTARRRGRDLAKRPAKFYSTCKDAKGIVRIPRVGGLINHYERVA
jgi:hypothetical protein